VSLDQRLGTAHILGQLIDGHDRAHLTVPVHQIAVVAEEALELVRLGQSFLALLSLGFQVGPVAGELLKLGCQLFVSLLGTGNKNYY